MGYQGAEWLERGERGEEEAPDAALDALKIPKGASVADIGAGSGYITERLAARVGATGRVFANDLQPQMLEILSRRLAAKQITNVTLVQGTVDDPKLAPASVDLELMVDVYHELSQPQVMLQHLREALRPGGRLVLLSTQRGYEIRSSRHTRVAEAKARSRTKGSRVEVDEARSGSTSYFHR